MMRLNLIGIMGFLLICAPALAAEPAVLDVTAFGVKPDADVVSTQGIQRAIDACASGGGGTVRFPAGAFISGTIQMKSNVTLHLDERATLLGSTNPDDYQNLDPFVDGSGNPMGYALIVGVEAHHVGLEGKGVIDGRGPALKRNQKTFSVRPFLIRWVRCSDVALSGLQLKDPGAWTLHFAQTNNATVDGLTIRTRTTKLRNNDGIDIDSSENVRIQNCDINSEDDAIVIKATSPQASRAITVKECTLSSHTNAIKLGTESYGGFDGVTVSHCRVQDTDMAGIALYEVDGGTLKNVTIDNISIDGVQAAISVRLGTRQKTFRDGEAPKPPGRLQDVTIQNVAAKRVAMIGMLINGVPGHPITGLTCRNIQIDLSGGGTAEEGKKELPEKETAYPEHNMFGRTIPAYGIYARHVDAVTFENVRMQVDKPDARPATVFMDVKGITPANFAATSNKHPEGNSR